MNSFKWHFPARERERGSSRECSGYSALGIGRWRKSSLAHVGRLPIESGHKVPSAAAAAAAARFISLDFPFFRFLPFAAFRRLLLSLLVLVFCQLFCFFGFGAFGVQGYKWQRDRVSHFSLRWTLARAAHRCVYVTPLAPSSGLRPSDAAVLRSFWQPAAWAVRSSIFPRVCRREKVEKCRLSVRKGTLSLSLSAIVNCGQNFKFNGISWCVETGKTVGSFQKSEARFLIESNQWKLNFRRI